MNLTAASARCADAQQVFQQIYSSSSPKPSNLFKTPRRATTPVPFSSDEYVQFVDSPPVSRQLSCSDLDEPFMADRPPKKISKETNHDLPLKVIKHLEASSLSSGLLDIVKEHFKEQWSLICSI